MPNSHVPRAARSFVRRIGVTKTNNYTPSRRECRRVVVVIVIGRDLSVVDEFNSIKFNCMCLSVWSFSPWWISTGSNHVRTVLRTARDFGERLWIRWKVVKLTLMLICVCVFVSCIVGLLLDYFISRANVSAGVDVHVNAIQQTFRRMPNISWGFRFRTSDPRHSIWQVNTLHSFGPSMWPFTRR